MGRNRGSGIVLKSCNVEQRTFLGVPTVPARRHNSRYSDKTEAVSGLGKDGLNSDWQGMDTLLKLSNSRVLRQSESQVKRAKKSDPGIGLLTSAITNLQMKDRRISRSRLSVKLP